MTNNPCGDMLYCGGMTRVPWEPEQELANYGPGATRGVPPVLVHSMS